MDSTTINKVEILDSESEYEEAESDDEDDQINEENTDNVEIYYVEDCKYNQNDSTANQLGKSCKKYKVCPMCYERKYGIVRYVDKNDHIISSKYYLNENQGVWNLFTQSYFKSTIDEGNFMVAPAIENIRPSDIMPLPFRMLTVLTRLLWATGDVNKLDKLVIESMRETLEWNLKHHFADCLSKMNLSAKEMESIKQCTTDNELIDASVKISVDREVESIAPPSYSPVMCYIKYPGRRLTIRSEEKTLLDLLHFKMNYSKKIEQMNFTNFNENFPIDWLNVSQKMFTLFDRWTTPEECEKVWHWNLRPSVNKDTLSTAEIEEFSSVMEEMGSDHKWHKIAAKINKGRTDMDYLQLSTMLPKESFEYPMSAEFRNEVVNMYLKYQDVNVVAARLNDIFPQMNVNIARTLCKTSLNPMLRKANFTSIEDAILLVALEVEKEEMLKMNWDFQIIMDWMPWRFSTGIKDRLNALLDPNRTPFTLEEDKLLLAAVDLMGKEWYNISFLFESNKGRKACEARYHQLTRLHKDVEDYHAEKNRKPQSMSWNSPLMRCMYKLAKVLQMWENVPPIDRSKLSRVGPPTDADLHGYIRSFPKNFVQTTLDKVIGHCHQNLDYHPMDRRPPPCDRRKFERNVPASWASVLHLRHIELKPLDEVDDPNDFELEIYAHFHKYGDRRPKSSIQRNIIPTAEELITYPEVSRILNLKEEINLKPFTTTPICIIKSERLKLEREEAEVYNGYNYLEASDEFQFTPDLRAEDTAHFTKEDVLNNTKYIPPPAVSYVELSQSTQIKRTRGPKKGYMKKVRSAAAKARWDKAALNKVVS